MPGTRPGSTADRVRRHRQTLRSQGLRPLQIWVPDLTLPAFSQTAQAQARAVAASQKASDDQAFIDALSTLNDE